MWKWTGHKQLNNGSPAAKPQIEIKPNSAYSRGFDIRGK
jgi:hypothetical protein